MNTRSEMRGLNQSGSGGALTGRPTAWVRGGVTGAFLVPLLLEGVDVVQVVIDQEFSGLFEVFPNVAQDATTGTGVDMEFLCMGTGAEVLRPLLMAA